MGEADTLPELKQILGAMIFAVDRALSVKEMRTCLKEVAEQRGGEARAFGDVKESDIREALDHLTRDLSMNRSGFCIQEVAGGYRFQSDAACGNWLKHILNTGKPRRLSWPALETLAIIAYRQPVTRTEIEGVRGVSVDHMVKTLMEMQLVRIMGRSELPGRPFTYGTTHYFLEHFGLKNLKELGKMNPSLLRRAEDEAPKVRTADWITDGIMEREAEAKAEQDRAIEKIPDSDEDEYDDEDDDDEDVAEESPEESSAEQEEDAPEEDETRR